MFKYYAGIGARKTPPDILQKMSQIAKTFSNLNYILRSGGAKGADKAFESQAKGKEIFYPGDEIEWKLRTKIYKIVMKHHPAPNYLGFSVQYHLRNVQIILGANLDTPVDFVVCWTENGKIIGGTAMGINLANAYGIPVYNLAIDNDIQRLRLFYQSLIKE